MFAPHNSAIIERGQDWMTLTNLRRAFLWAALYLALILVLGQADYIGKPIINFASYFYLVAMIGVPVTLFFPGVTRVSTYIPMLVWGGIYFFLLFFVDRRLTTTSNELSIVVLEFALLETGIWLAHQLAKQINHAESIMDELAVGAFPHRAEALDEGSNRVKIEFNRSRRYHRPLALLLIDVDLDVHKTNGENLKHIQYDIMNRFTSARIGQIIDDRIRQTDLVLRDRQWSYVIICPETDYSSVLLLAKRISQAVKEKTGLTVLWGIAAFPEEALTFDDMLRKARGRLASGDAPLDSSIAQSNADKEISNV
jgi:GGDEF domain-containing protein